ncbi:MAG: lipoyl synthase [Proteobacteria bacterium]|nr:lipoyl synthase [Pseudomonadota bacterium]
MLRKPKWLKVKLPQREEYSNVKKILREERLHTVCVEAKCPNLGQCWDSGTATFMILGDTCTRACKFCATKTGNPKEIVDSSEPDRLLDAVKRMGLDYVVITSVDRDDLDDFGAGIFIRTAELLRKDNPQIGIEVLTPDFGGRKDLIDAVLDSGINVFAHNIEVVRRISPFIRDVRANYNLSMSVLKAATENKNIIIKSGMMVGIGETDEEVYKTIEEVASVGVKIFTIGQYLQPTRRNIEVQRYVTPEIFKSYEEKGKEVGVYVVSGPLVRSSYMAKEVYNKVKNA